MKDKMKRIGIKNKLQRVSLKPLSVLMNRQGKSQYEVSRRMNVSLPTLRTYIRDPRKMDDYQVERFAKAVGVPKQEIQAMINEIKQKRNGQAKEHSNA